MSNDRVKDYLSQFLQRNPQEQQNLMPLILNWEKLLQQIPGFRKKNPGRHCRISEFMNHQVLIDADHPAWLQLLQLHEKEIVSLLNGQFPDLKIAGIRFRLIKDEEDARLRPFQEPEPVKTPLSEAEQVEMESILGELESLLKNRKENRG